MFTVRKQFRFEAAHKLADHDGKCARLHGHSYVGYIEVTGEYLVSRGPKRNMVVDFGDLSYIVKPLVESHLDHHYLNETLNCDHTTAEYIAAWIYEQVAARLNTPTLKHAYNNLGVVVQLEAVEIEETCTSAVRYTRRR